MTVTREPHQKVAPDAQRTSSWDGLDSDALLGEEDCGTDLDLNYQLIWIQLSLKELTYPATLQDLIIIAKSELGTALGELCQTTNA